MKSLVAISNINALPDGHLHSKISFLKSIINQQPNPQLRQKKQNMFKISYTIKNIGIHGEQIGITSKRMPLKQKQEYKPLQITKDKQKQIYKTKYLPQNTFYSQALISIRKSKNQQQQQNDVSKSKNPFLITASNFNQNQFSQNFHISPNTKFAKKLQIINRFGRNFSHASKFKNTSNKESNQKQEQFIQKVTTMQRSKSEYEIPNKNKFTYKKSFSKMLNQFGRRSKNVQIMPLQRQQNSMFKKIKKIHQLSTSKQVQMADKYRSARMLSRSSSTFTGRYQAMTSTTRKLNVQKTLNKIE